MSALAIEEQRNSFIPLRFDDHIGPSLTLEQVWFIGAHSDVGNVIKLVRFYHNNHILIVIENIQAKRMTPSPQQTRENFSARVG